MPAGPQLIEAVAQCLAANAGEAKMALHPSEIQVLLETNQSKRAIRSALIREQKALKANLPVMEVGVQLDFLKNIQLQQALL